MNAPSFTFRVHGERLAIARLSHSAAVPAWARGGFVTVSRTPTELSIVCPQRRVPQKVRHERDKLALGIEGTIALTTIGILAALCGTLAAAGVPVFVISTYDTDWLLVSAERFAAAKSALESAGHRVIGECPAAD
jgi:hypothetical protein